MSRYPPWGWVRRSASRAREHFLFLAIAGSALGFTVGLIVKPAGHVIDSLKQQVPWLVPIEIALDGLIGLGVIMMLSATGFPVRNPVKARRMIRELVRNANGTLLFRRGFVLSTLAALAWGGVAAASVVIVLPPQAWGALIYPTVDLGATIVLRRAIWQRMRTPYQSPSQAA